MKLELAVETRRLKMVEDHLAVLQREADELCDAMIIETLLESVARLTETFASTGDVTTAEFITVSKARTI